MYLHEQFFEYTGSEWYDEKDLYIEFLEGRLETLDTINTKNELNKALTDRTITFRNLIPQNFGEGSGIDWNKKFSLWQKAKGVIIGVVIGLKKGLKGAKAHLAIMKKFEKVYKNKQKEVKPKWVVCYPDQLKTAKEILEIPWPSLPEKKSWLKSNIDHNIKVGDKITITDLCNKKHNCRITKINKDGFSMIEDFI